MGNIFKVFFSISTILLLSGCDYFDQEKRHTELCKIQLDEVYKNSPLNNFAQQKFVKLLESRHSLYKEMFDEASIETSINTDLLSAISFQESQWDPRAQSNMGVRGMMMVTLETAALVGVEKRLNPEQNIKGGARYLAILMDKNIYGKTTGDQLSITLASYNLGPTNIINISKTIDKIPSEITWFDIEDKLQEIKGEDVNLVDVNDYSRGQQAIDYVYRIKNYYELMAAHSCTNPKDQLTFF
jgi:membrane-bound lytic murein transglycosylase F